MMRIDSLDGLRGLAILLVLIYHSYAPFTQGGFIGVDIFFVLSGFLITTLLMKEHDTYGTIRFKKFYMRRFLRLAPALFLVLFSFYIYSQLYMSGEKQDGALLSIMGALFYVANLAKAFEWFSMGYLLPMWSLSVEEQFYLIWPLLLLSLLAFFSCRKSLMIVVAIMIISVWVNRSLLAIDGVSLERLYYGSDTHCDGLLVGCLAALLTIEYKHNLARVSGVVKKYTVYIPVIILLFYILSTLVMGRGIRSIYIWYLPLLEVLSALLIVYLYLRKSDRVVFFSNKYLVWLGSISYGLYLWHWVVYRVVADIGGTGIDIAIYGSLASILLATISYYFVEKPVLRVKERFY